MNPSADPAAASSRLAHGATELPFNSHLFSSSIFTSPDPTAAPSAKFGDTGGARDSNSLLTTTALPTTFSATDSSTFPTFSPTPSSTPSSVPSSTSGLSTAAIAGIAAGCGAALVLLLVVIACYLLARRRKSRGSRQLVANRSLSQGHDGFDSASAGRHEFVTDKEINSHNTSPNSPSSYPGENPVLDASLLGAVGSANAAASPALPHNHLLPSSVAPESTHHSAAPLLAATPSAPHMADSPTGRGSANGISRSFAALVEDGMTDDEIRRLEEEERTLDRAIEEAGHR